MPGSPESHSRKWQLKFCTLHQDNSKQKDNCEGCQMLQRVWGRKSRHVYSYS